MEGAASSAPESTREEAVSSPPEVAESADDSAAATAFHSSWADLSEAAPPDTAEAPHPEHLIQLSGEEATGLEELVGKRLPLAPQTILGSTLLNCSNHP